MIYAFEDFNLDTRQQILTQKDVEIKVEPQVFDLLQLLIENHDRLVTKSEIVESIWQGRAISDTAIASRISSARRALGDSGQQQRLIKTIHNKGLRFLGRTTVNGQIQPDNAQPSIITNVFGKPSVIVMPFRARPDNEMEMFTADALVDEISALLTAMEGVNVIPRYAAGFTLSVDTDPIALARSLGAQYVVTGHVRRENQRLRVRAILTNINDNRQLWSEKFDGTLEDIFMIEDKVTSGVIGALGGKIAHVEAIRVSRQAPENLQAWELARRALSAALDWRRETLAESVHSCKRAIELDPDYAHAHAYLGFYLAWRAAQGWSEDIEAERHLSEHHAEQALRLTHQDGEVLSAIGDTYRVLGDPVRASKFYDEMKAKNPDVFNIWPVSLPMMGIAYAQAGYDTKARDLVQEFESKFPSDDMGRIWSRVALGYIELCTENYSQVEQLHTNAPSEYTSMCRIIALVKLGQMDDARAEYRRTQTTYGTKSLSHYIEHFKRFHVDLEIGKTLSEALSHFNAQITA